LGFNTWREVIVALFVVKHLHAAERCPARDPYQGASLLNHLSRPSVAQFGVKIRGEAVVKGEHTLYLIVEADDESQVRGFLRPFESAGSVDVYPASTCAWVVASGNCGAPMPVSRLEPALDPADACQNAIESGLVVHRAHPLNGETSIPALVGGVVMPNASFYLRNHFHIPMLNSENYQLKVGGFVTRPLCLSLRELRAMRSRSQTVTLECAGNGRALFDPPIEGEKWDLGAVSTAEWTGVPLLAVLERAGARKNAREALFRGADGGAVDGRPEPIRFERSLRLDDAQISDALLAYAMNGEPLPIRHGYPLRLIVPNWYAVTSVKWLTEIQLIDRQFDGFFQTDRYWYQWDRSAAATSIVSEPVSLQRVRSLITEPGYDQEVQRGERTIRGVAWSGAAAIARVEVSLGKGGWLEARLLGEPRRGSWQWWDLVARLEIPGVFCVRARATDAAGHTQPDRAEWNRLGYGNNSIQRVQIRVV
jgi:DMSO/TMAO reductase YedYZ molybdopterin-dependent catalytic subunit